MIKNFVRNSKCNWIQFVRTNRLTFQFTTIVTSLPPIPFLIKCKIFSIKHVYVYIYIYICMYIEFEMKY